MPPFYLVLRHPHVLPLLHHASRAGESPLHLELHTDHATGETVGLVKAVQVDIKLKTLVEDHTNSARKLVKIYPDDPPKVHLLYHPLLY